MLSNGCLSKHVCQQLHFWRRGRAVILLDGRALRPGELLVEGGKRSSTMLAGAYVNSGPSRCASEHKPPNWQPVRNVARRNRARTVHEHIQLKEGDMSYCQHVWSTPSIARLCPSFAWSYFSINLGSMARTSETISVFLSSCLSMYLYLCTSIYLMSIYLCLSVYLSIYLPVCPTVRVEFCLYLLATACICLYPSIWLSALLAN